MKIPCKGCGEREVGCHGICERYKEYSAWRANVLAAKAEQYKAEAVAAEGRLKRREALRKRGALK